MIFEIVVKIHIEFITNKSTSNLIFKKFKIISMYLYVIFYCEIYSDESWMCLRASAASFTGPKVDYFNFV